MRNYSKMIIASLMSALVVGCASTDSSTGPNGYPTLKVLSDKPYVWDDSISEALNVARMAQPAGVGNGMKDFTDGTEANTGRIGGGTRAVDAGLGLLSQGVFGVISMEALNSGVNRQLDWKPAIVDFIPVSDVSSENQLKDIQNFIGGKIRLALTKDYPNLEWHGAYTVKRSGFNNFNTDFIFFDNEGCKASLNYSYIEKDKAKPFFEKVNEKVFLEDGAGISRFCDYGGKLSIAGTRVIDGIVNYIVIFEVAFGHYFDKSIADNYDGYFITSEKYNFVAVDKPMRIVVNRNHASVFKQGSEHLFQK